MLTYTSCVKKFFRVKNFKIGEIVDNFEYFYIYIFWDNRMALVVADFIGYFLKNLTENRNGCLLIFF